MATSNAALQKLQGKFERCVGGGKGHHLVAREEVRFRSVVCRDWFTRLPACGEYNQPVAGCLILNRWRNFKHADLPQVCGHQSCLFHQLAHDGYFVALSGFDASTREGVKAFGGLAASLHEQHAVAAQHCDRNGGQKGWGVACHDSIKASVVSATASLIWVTRRREAPMQAADMRRCVETDKTGMCGRFTLIQTPREVAEIFNLVDLDAFPARYNIAPTQPILMVSAAPARSPGSNLPERQAVLVRWGLIPTWSKDPKSMPLLINARSESAIEKPAFRAAMRHRRTLIPTSGFFEWKRQGKVAKPYWIRPKKGGVIAFGGLMETFLEPGGSEIDTGAILTTTANNDIRHIHHRMPVVIRPEDFSRWLDCRTQEPREVADLMQPVEAGYFEVVPVSDRVNSHANVGAENIEPVSDAETTETAIQLTETQLKLF